MSERMRGRIMVYVAGVLTLTAIALALLAAAPLQAQQAEAELLTTPRVHVGVQAPYARPVGEFRDYVKHGGGLDVNAVWTPVADGAFALRADAGFLVYGSETKRVCFSSTVGCRVDLDLTTTNTIAHFGVGPQLMLPHGAVRPYVNAGIGFAYFGTTSQVEGTNSSESLASTTNFDDITLAWTTGGGLLIPVSRGPTPVAIDIGARYHGNGEVEYLRKGDIQDNPDGSITITPTRSEANLVTFRIGVSIGVRGSRNE